MRVRHYLYFTYLLLLVFALGCSGSKQSEEPAIEDAWYNSYGFRSIFGDFESVELREVFDEKTALELIEEGRYLAKGPAACGACHGLEPGNPNSPLAGGMLMTDRFGNVRAANITPDKEHGIGTWNYVSVMRAIRASIDREGRPLSLDVHQGYRWMADRDLKALSFYVLSLEPNSNAVDRRSLGGFERNAYGVIPQHKDVKGYVTQAKSNSGFERGMYLAESVSQCIACHTGEEGLFSSARPFAGGAITMGEESSVFAFEILKRFFKEEGELDAATSGLISDEAKGEIEGSTARAEDKTTRQVIDDLISAGHMPLRGPDIRGSSEVGLASWLEADIVKFLSNGETPGGREVDGRVCPWPYFAGMSESDKQAVAAFIKKL